MQITVIVRHVQAMVNGDKCVIFSSVSRSFVFPIQALYYFSCVSGFILVVGCVINAFRWLSMLYAVAYCGSLRHFSILFKRRYTE